MLSILLLLAAAPQSAVPPMPSNLGAPSQQPGDATTRALGETPDCTSDLRRAGDPITPDAGLMWREGGEAVALYRLLDRRVNGCPAPVIVSYRVPGSNAVGREMGREPAPFAGVSPRP